MLKEMLMSKFETYLLDEETEQLHTKAEETGTEQENYEREYPPGFFSAL